MYQKLEIKPPPKKKKNTFYFIKSTPILFYFKFIFHWGTQYTYNGYNNDGSKQVRCKRLLSEPAVEFDTIFDVFKESFLDQMGCSDQDKDEIKNAMKIYYDNIDMNALSNEIQTNDNFFNEFGNDVNSINKIMKTDITNEQGTSADNNTTENNVSTSQVDEQPEASTSGVERMKERSNLFANNLTEEKNDTGDIKKEENKSKPSQLDGNNHKIIMILFWNIKIYYEYILF
ncbi:hypothetical protein PFMC_02671 [Plasmodium falciparum CAMP/Malaysia]|uniref:Uncharacterized protein n=1 Tax=Plasmodium falciparum (isolate Camp / Malaysia) TaxID=5835 RepID=A0A024X8W9_PLAFC|nr:hypothetical protein PFMC_02671 [Plasmodium falciparum CAMP/Malaysia]